MKGRNFVWGAAVALAVTGSAPASAAVYGTCGFDTSTSRFKGTVRETLTCLLRKVRVRGSGADVQPIPDWLIQRVARPVPFTIAQLRAYLDRENIQPAALTRQMTAGDAALARYFVIHDTSSPEIPSSGTTFPSNINEAGYPGNSLTASPVLRQQVNLLITRDGRSVTLTDWAAARPRAATKLENRPGVQSRVFVHVENKQPRIRPPGSWAWRAPVPGFGPAQEKRLALAYIVASLRAGRWLIPAYHFNVDQGVGEAHDDPQNVDLQSWVARLAEIESAIVSQNNP